MLMLTAKHVFINTALKVIPGHSESDVESNVKDKNKNKPNQYIILH